MEIAPKPGIVITNQKQQAKQLQIHPGTEKPAWKAVLNFVDPYGFEP